jgi:NDP-4-keto-2,6-dideoxyhexose 3-C-methyltransferase
MITTWTACRACKSPDLDVILDLGTLALSTFLSPTDAAPPRAPLQLVICGTCDLVQLRHSVEPDRLFRKYWYLSGINEAMKAELKDVVDQASAMVGDLRRNTDTVIDIGANDGTLLAHVGAGPCRVAYEPALNLYDLLRPHASVLVADYFPHGSRAQGLRFSAKLITSVACFYDLDDPHAFVSGIKEMLHPDGVWIVQFQDLFQMLHATAFDNICHEHVTYPSLQFMQQLCADHDLEIVDAERRAINGGSLRLYVRHPGVQRPTAHVAELRAREANLYTKLQEFSWRVTEVQRQLIATLEEARQAGPVDCYGASTKFSTLAQYCGIGPQHIRQCVERSPEKVGLQTVTGIPIVSEATWREQPAALTLIAIWQFREFILTREAAYLSEGGRFLVPLPQVEVVYAELARLEELT